MNVGGQARPGWWRWWLCARWLRARPTQFSVPMPRRWCLPTPAHRVLTAPSPLPCCDQIMRIAPALLPKLRLTGHRTRRLLPCCPPPCCRSWPSPPRCCRSCCRCCKTTSTVRRCAARRSPSCTPSWRRCRQVLPLLVAVGGCWLLSVGQGRSLFYKQSWRCKQQWQGWLQRWFVVAARACCLDATRCPVPRPCRLPYVPFSELGRSWPAGLPWQASRPCCRRSFPAGSASLRACSAGPSPQRCASLLAAVPAPLPPPAQRFQGQRLCCARAAPCRGGRRRRLPGCLAAPLQLWAPSMQDPEGWWGAHAVPAPCCGVPPSLFHFCSDAIASVRPTETHTCTGPRGVGGAHGVPALLDAAHHRIRPPGGARHRPGADRGLAGAAGRACACLPASPACCQAWAWARLGRAPFIPGQGQTTAGAGAAPCKRRRHAKRGRSAARGWSPWQLRLPDGPNPSSDASATCRCTPTRCPCFTSW